MGLVIKAVTAAAEVSRMMVLRSNFAIRRGLEEQPCTGCRSSQTRHFAESVVVAVVRTAGSMRSKEIRTYLAVLTHDRSIEIGMDIIARMLVDMTDIGDIDEVADGFLGNDIHYTGNSVRAVHRRSASTNDLYAVDHRCRHLLQTIDRSHRGEDRTRVHENLGILTLQTIDTQIRLAAVGAGVLHPQARLKIQRVRHTCYRRRLKEFGREDIDDCRRFLTLGSISVCGHYDILQQLCLLMDSGLEFHRPVFNNINRQLLCLVPYVTEDDDLATQRKVFEQIMAGFIGHCTDIRALQLNIHKRQVFSCFCIQHVTREVRVMLGKSK